MCLNFRLEWLGRRRYSIIWNSTTVGNIEFKVTRCGQIHIYHVYVDDDYRDKVKMWKFFSSFDEIVAHKVLPEALHYWRRLGAHISEVIDLQFQDIIIEEDDLDDL